MKTRQCGHELMMPLAILPPIVPMWNPERPAEFGIKNFRNVKIFPNHSNGFPCNSTKRKVEVCITTPLPRRHSQDLQL